MESDPIAAGVRARWILLLPAIFAGSLGAQQPSTLDAVVVVAERSATPINLSVAAVTRLTAADLARVPAATLADVLRQVPGFAVVDFDGLGRDPQVMARGFYGGGEADYVLVMVDGRVVNRVHNGTITWETLPPLSSIESIEIVRGSSSTMHGDAAVAGVINIVTRRPTGRTAAWRLGSESFTGVSASTDFTGQFTDRDFAASLGFDRTDGFRDHAARASAIARGTMRLTRQFRGTLNVSWRNFEEPGPVLENLRQDGSESDPRFRDDGGTDAEWGATIDHDGVLGAGGTARTTFRVGQHRLDLVRTLPLTPDFGDTRERELRTLQLGLATQLDLTPTILPPGFDRVSAGVSADLGTIDSRYYSDNNGNRTADASGDGRRATLAGFLHLAATPVERVRFTFGVRADLLSDAFVPDGGIENFSATHFAFSPRMGLNFRYAADGNAWISASRTFKAPTLDQLFDQRPIPVPFPPFTATTSNPDLDPQRGTGVEAGLYQDLSVANTRLGVSLTLYQLDMRDELDFDVQTLRYVNIARSRHRGTEAGVTATRGIISGYASLTIQDAISRAGANTGNRLKAVPGQIMAAGITISPTTLGTVSIAVARNADMYLDDASRGRPPVQSRERIPAWTRVDAQFSRSVGPLEFTAGARNLLDERYDATAFLDPSGSGQRYVYPAAGRVVTLGVRFGR